MAVRTLYETTGIQEAKGMLLLTPSNPPTNLVKKETRDPLCVLLNHALPPLVSRTVVSRVSTKRFPAVRTRPRLPPVIDPHPLVPWLLQHTSFVNVFSTLDSDVARHLLTQCNVCVPLHVLGNCFILLKTRHFSFRDDVLVTHQQLDSGDRRACTRVIPSTHLSHSPLAEYRLQFLYPHTLPGCFPCINTSKLLSRALDFNAKFNPYPSRFWATLPHCVDAMLTTPAHTLTGRRWHITASEGGVWQSFHMSCVEHLADTLRCLCMPDSKLIFHTLTQMAPGQQVDSCDPVLSYQVSRRTVWKYVRSVLTRCEARAWVTQKRTHTHTHGHTRNMQDKRHHTVAGFQTQSNEVL
eukprot:Blabericola_migrator_1__1176@NODE_12_length_24658_cov_176_683258_g9_i0_p9_GENE_NODE_12_length_24658_cov_176_683258_g9_i0NODE_12_length_24658_cov_176_683258_g9_i0_p9_ORF_typecomplete_len352_score50_41_NODE_12_length_24658_cov_176_683258_g9_i023613416